MTIIHVFYAYLFFKLFIFLLYMLSSTSVNQHSCFLHLLQIYTARVGNYVICCLAINYNRKPKAFVGNGRDGMSPSSL